MHIGPCKLCCNKRELVQSHIWSRFGYKRYTADLSKGGQFIDLREGRAHNKQYTEEWMCEECEERLGVAETYTAKWLSNLESQPDVPHQYDCRLVKFVASISWRTTLFLDRDPAIKSIHFNGAMKRWRQFLHDRKRTVLPYSQHVFPVFDRHTGLHKMLGGELCEDFVISQLGPLLMVGLFNRPGSSPSEIKVWRASELNPGGGTVEPLQAWIVGRGGNTPKSLIRRLVRRNELAAKVGKEMQAAREL